MTLNKLVAISSFEHDLAAQQDSWQTLASPTFIKVPNLFMGIEFESPLSSGRKTNSDNVVETKNPLISEDDIDQSSEPNSTSDPNPNDEDWGRAALRTGIKSALNAAIDMLIMFPSMVLTRQFQTGAKFHPRFMDYFENCGTFTIPYATVMGGSDAASEVATKKGVSSLWVTAAMASVLGGGVAAPLEAPVIWAHQNKTPSGKVPSYRAAMSALGKRVYTGAGLIVKRDTVSSMVFLKGPAIIRAMGGDPDSYANLGFLGFVGGVVSGTADDLRTNWIETGKSPFSSMPRFMRAIRGISKLGLATRGAVFSFSSVAYADWYNIVSVPLTDRIMRLPSAVSSFLSK